MLQEIKPDEIYHCAGSVGRDFGHLFQSNVVTTAHLLEAVRLHTPSARVLLNGSAASYGNVDPAHNPIPESLQPRPVTPYGFCKATQTELMRYFHSNYALHVKEARIFNLCGPGAPEHLVNGRVEMLIEQYLKGQVTEKGVPLEVLREEGASNTQPLEIFADLQKFNQLVQATGKK